jgi:hypothetical protein
MLLHFREMGVFKKDATRLAGGEFRSGGLLHTAD